VPSHAEILTYCSEQGGIVVVFAFKLGKENFVILKPIRRTFDKLASSNSQVDRVEPYLGYLKAKVCAIVQIQVIFSPTDIRHEDSVSSWYPPSTNLASERIGSRQSSEPEGLQIAADVILPRGKLSFACAEEKLRTR